MCEYVVVEYLQQYREHSVTRHSTAQRNHPRTKQQPNYVPIRVLIKRSMYVHACGVPFVFLEHGPLGIAPHLFAPKMLDHLLHLPFRFILPCERA